MKKQLCTILAAILAASTLAVSLVSCAVGRDSASASSSDSGDSKYAAFLADRGVTPPSLTVVKADGETKYGVDMSSFEDDGYFIRAEHGEVALVARTDEGLDRAVRRYANYGNPDDYEYTYHEGYRVKSLTVCGRDISGFVVVKDDDADECQSFAADELVKYIERACGAKLAIMTASEYVALDTGAKPLAIRLAVDYPALGDEAFRVTVSENGIRIDGGRYRGCMYGVYDLLEDIGWRFVEDPVTGGNSLLDYLYEAEHVDLTSALDREEHGATDYRCVAGVATRDRNNDIAAKYREMDVGGDNAYAKHGQFGLLGHTCHGINNYKAILLDEGLWIGGQPCYSDPDTIETVQNTIRSRTEDRLAAGQQIGREIVTFDVSHDDNTDFCNCKRCLNIIKEEGARSGITLRFANAIAEMLAEEYPGTWVATFAYNGTCTPPAKARPLPNVRVAYCLYVEGGRILCTAHNGTGVDCPPDCVNRTFGDELSTWAKMCTNNNLEVWYYPFIVYGQGFGCPIFTGEYETLSSLLSDEYNVNSMMICSGDGNGLHQESLAIHLCSRMMWDGASVTRDDYNALIEEWFNIFYGDAAEYMLEYFRQIEIAGQKNGCWRSFHGPNYRTVNNEYVAAHFDEWWDLYKAAKLACGSAKEEELVERYMAGMMYICIGITYDDRYTNGTAEERAVIAERYTEMHRIFRKYNLKTFDDYITVEYTPEELDLDTNPFEAFLPVTKYDVMK